MAAVEPQLQRANGQEPVPSDGRTTTVARRLLPDKSSGKSVLTSNTRRTSPGIAPSEEAWAWQLSARCRDEDTAQFFHPEGERGQARKRREHRAKAICARCPVVLQCLQHAMKFPEP